MRAGRDGWRFLPGAGGTVLMAALVWSAVVMRSAESLPAGTSVVLREVLADAARARSEEASPPTEPRSGPPRIWSTTVRGEAGLFDPGRSGPPVGAEPPRIRGRDMELVGTRALPFRLQLTGHLGEDADLRGIFEAEDGSGPLIARVGDELADLDLAIRGLELESAPGDGAPARVQARIWDRRAGRELVLSESVRVESGVGVALLAPRGYPGEAIELLAGEIVAVNADEFRVERVGLDPASATLRRLSTGGTDEAADELILQVEGGPES